MEVGVFGDIGLNVVLFVVIWVLENVIDYVIILFYRMVGKFVRVRFLILNFVMLYFVFKVYVYWCLDLYYLKLMII